MTGFAFTVAVNSPPEVALTAAATSSLATIDAPNIHLTASGAVNVTSFGSDGGVPQERRVRFDASITITASSSLITLTGENRVTSAGAIGRYYSDGSSNWREVYFSDPSGALLAPVGTVILFQQATAPVGWQQLTTHNDKAIRIVSGTPSFGGTNSFSSVFAQTVVGSWTLSTSQMPSHVHGVPTGGDDGASSGTNPGISYNTGNDLVEPTVSTTANGGGASHNHSIEMDILYVDVMAAQKT